MTYKIGISGHRALENADAVRNNIKVFLKQQLIKKPDVVCLSALAEGADSIFAEEALKLKLPLEVILPFSKDEYMKCFSGEALKNFNSLFDSAESTHSINESSIMTEQEREQNYLDCGIEVADQSDFMLLVYNKLKAGGIGGTGDIVEYCKAHSINHHIIKSYRSTIERLESESNKKADVYQKKHKRMWVWTLFLGLTAAIMFAINLSFVIQQPYLLILNTVEFSCLIIGIFLFRKLENGILKTKRITARRDAELLRTTGIYINAGIPLEPLENIKLYPNYNKPEVKDEIEKFDSKIDYIKVFEAKQIQSLNKIIKHQKNDYHEKRIKKITHALSLWTALQKGLLIVFVLLAFFHFALSVISFYNGQLSEQLVLINRVTLFLVIILPPILGATEAYIYFSELRKNLKDSQYMVKFFIKKEKELNDSNLSKENFSVIAKQIRQKMDDENLNWCISTDSNANGKL